MVAKGNKDGHRMSYSGMKGVVETEKWGRSAAYDRYNGGKPPDFHEGAPYPKDQSRAEDQGSRMGWRGVGDTGDSWLTGGGPKRAEGNPNFRKTGDNPPRSPATQGPGGRKKSPGF